ncbi:MAG: twin-arginine translocation signal domain-containing protein [Phycisphaerales bacterium]|nr:MAG: twin-arginine translocation signal domain-containing protein [Phycisphaerales bacterium]
MNRYTDKHLDRRDFLKTLGITAASLTFDRLATARHLILVNTSGPAQISRVEWIPYDTGRRGSGGSAQQQCAVRVSTTSGAQGWADFSISVAPDEQTKQLISDTLLEQDPAHPEKLWRRLYQQGLPLGTLAAVDVALWDLRARMEDKSVHALLGAKRQKVKTCLNTGFNFGEPADYALIARQGRSSGVAAIKIQPYIEWGAGRDGLADAGFPDKDMAVYRAVREAVGDEYPCIADSQGSHTYDEALRVGHLLDNLGFAWYESPMPETDAWVERYVALAGELRTPICAPEAYPDAYEPRLAWIEQRACDVSRINIYHGGLTACLQLASACEEAGIALTLADAGPDGYPYLPLMASTSEPVTPYFEIASLFREPNVLPGRTLPEPVFDGDGLVAIPQTPGMGLELDWQYIATHRVR